MNTVEKVVALTPREGCGINPGALLALRGSDGCALARTTMGEALEDLALALSRVAQAYREDRFHDLREAACTVGRIAASLDLDRLARVARTVAGLSTTTDCTALAANVARLVRLGNGALGAIWELQDQIV
ncbi:hypothetical protein [Oceaniglobus roseus]|uniref:hypothetical protein n=1 Tax=Oceaniglobus roseus TaxID=1737570 RepID=UPI000C7EF85D|nr:hypothetical protein [Kandeliimicrobium roseum]